VIRDVEFSRAQHGTEEKYGNDAEESYKTAGCGCSGPGESHLVDLNISMCAWRGEVTPAARLAAELGHPRAPSAVRRRRSSRHLLATPRARRGRPPSPPAQEPSPRQPAPC